MKAVIPAAIIGLMVLGGLALWFFSGSETVVPEPDTGGIEGTNSEDVATPAEIAAVEDKRDLIYLDSLTPGGSIASPLEVTGSARGYWYFEASFPIALLNRNGQTIARGIAQAQGDWMTEEFVPFKATLSFKSPYISGDPVFLSHGTLVLQKDNPSGEPENDDSLRVPIQFEPNVEATPFSISIPSPVTIYDGIEVMDNIETLDLSGRGLEGSLKAEIRMVSKLEHLDISDNNFTGLPAEVGQLSQLRILNLSNNPFTGLPYELGNLKKLRVLDLRGTQYSEADLEVIRSSWSQSVEVLADNVEEESDEEGAEVETEE